MPPDHVQAVRSLVNEATRSGVRLAVVEGRLQYRAPNGRIPEALRSGLQSHKDGLVAELSRPAFRKRETRPAQLTYPAYWLDFWRETETNPSLANSTHAAVRLKGDISPDRIAAALRVVEARHDILRAKAVLIDGIPTLRFDQFNSIAFDVVDVHDSQKLTEQVSEAIWAPFADGSLCRARLLRIATDDYVVAFVVHHFVADYISCQMLTSELLTAALSHTAPSVTARPLQFSDYLLSMGEWLSGSVLQYRLDYWMRQMGGAPEISLPRAHSANGFEATIVHKHVFEIASPLRAGIARSAASCGVPFAVVILAAKLAALARALHTHDVFVTIIASGREHPALMDLIGPTVNCFPVRVAVLPDMTYAELLNRVNESYQLARDYQLPWALLMRTLAPTGTECIAPIFNFTSGRHGTRGGNNAVPTGVEVIGVDVPTPAETNTVRWKSHDFGVFDSGTDLSVTLKYMPARYDAATIAGFGTTFVECLQAMASDPTRTIGQ